MLLTLSGRIITRIVVTLVIGGLVTLVITPLLPNDAGYDDTFMILLVVTVLGVLWELVYHGIQQFRWEKDWPTLFGYVTMLNEGALVYLLVKLGAVPGVSDDLPFSTFVIHFFIVWNVVWLWVNGPMRVPFIRWRFRGGSIA
jgi:hypothetical protein